MNYVETSSLHAHIHNHHVQLVKHGCMEYGSCYIVSVADVCMWHDLMPLNIHNKWLVGCYRKSQRWKAPECLMFGACYKCRSICKSQRTLHDTFAIQQLNTQYQLCVHVHCSISAPAPSHMMLSFFAGSNIVSCFTISHCIWNWCDLFCAHVFSNLLDNHTTNHSTN